jgi:hypothetical protein
MHESTSLCPQDCYGAGKGVRRITSQRLSDEKRRPHPPPLLEATSSLHTTSLELAKL